MSGSGLEKETARTIRASVVSTRYVPNQLLIERTLMTGGADSEKEISGTLYAATNVARRNLCRTMYCAVAAGGTVHKACRVRLENPTGLPCH